MKGSLIIIAFFAAGILLGLTGHLPAFLENPDISAYILYFLMFQVGITIGGDKKIKKILNGVRPNFY